MVVKCRQLNSADQKVVEFPFLLLLFARLFITKFTKTKKM